MLISRDVSRNRNLAGMLLLVLVLWILYLVEAKKVVYYEIASSSMEPALKAGARRIMIRPEAYQTGDIVVLTDPKGGGEMVSRLAGMETDHILMKRGILYINGKRWVYANGMTSPADMPDVDFSLPSGHVYVVCDNMSSGYDSREFGPVLVNDLKGILVESDHGMRFWN